MLPRERRCERYCNSASDSFRMTVSRHSRHFGLVNHHVKIVGEIRTQWSNSHGGAVPKGALAFKQRLRFLSPMPSPLAMIFVAVIDLFKAYQTRCVIPLLGKDVILCRLRAIKRGA